MTPGGKKEDPTHAAFERTNAGIHDAAMHAVPLHLVVPDGRLYRRAHGCRGGIDAEGSRVLWRGDDGVVTDDEPSGCGSFAGRGRHVVHVPGILLLYMLLSVVALC